MGRLRPPSKIEIDGQLARVELTRGLWATIDISYISMVDGYRWHAHVDNGGLIYAIGYINRIPFRMHRLIAGETNPKIHVDHIDRDTLNNRRINLRSCAPSRNHANRGPQANNKCGLKGVSYNKRLGKWVAQICIEGSRKWLGVHYSKESASAAYDKAALELFGEFAVTNFQEQLAA